MGIERRAMVASGLRSYLMNVVCAGIALIFSACACSMGGEEGGLEAQTEVRDETPEPVEEDAVEDGPLEGMVEIPAGTFFRGSGEGDRDESPRRSVRLDAFQMDIHEVTVADYEKCVEDHTCKIPHADFQYCRGEYVAAITWGHEARRMHPVNCVDWYQARTYCEWAGKRLPTEAEWEYAAKGTDGRAFPWGDQSPSCQLAVIREKGRGCGKGHTAPVGSKPKGVSPFGVHDMAGNVYEWVADKYSSVYYAKGPTDNPKGAVGSSKHVVRGGSWFNPASFQRASDRDARGPANAYVFVGFRCAK